MKVEVDAGELAVLRNECERLREQVTALQTANTELIEYARDASIRTHVAQFHRIAGLPILERPTRPPPERMRVRVNLLAEQLFEVLDTAFRAWLSEPWLLDECRGRLRTFVARAQVREDLDLTALARELCRLDYYAEGARLECGIDGGPVLREVHASTLRKLDGVYGEVEDEDDVAGAIAQQISRP